MRIRTRKTTAAPEHDLQILLSQYAVLRGWLVIRINSGSKGNISFYKVLNNGKSEGISDLILSRNGFSFYLEVKDKGKKQRESQIEFEALAHKFKMDYVVADNLDEGMRLIDAFTNKARKYS